MKIQVKEMLSAADEASAGDVERIGLAERSAFHPLRFPDAAGDEHGIEQPRDEPGVRR